MTQITFQQLKKLSKTDASALPQYSLAVLGDCATQHLATALRGYGVSVGMRLNVFDADYDQIDAQVMAPDSELYRFAPQGVLLQMCTEKLQEAFYDRPLEARASFAEDTYARIRQIWSRIGSHIPATVLQCNFPLIDDGVFGQFGNKTEQSFLFQQRKLNYLLTQGCQEAKNTFLIDLDALQTALGRSTFADPKLYYVAKMPISLAALPAAAKLVVDVVRSLQGAVKKWLKELKNRGILLTVCSKNNEDTAKEPFEKHPEMVLRLEDFSMFVANWEDKARNIRTIQQSLNIGMDSMVFLDDNPFERELVRTMIPEITVPELPEDPALYLQYLRGLDLFETASYSREDAGRTEQYREKAQRAAFEAAFQSYDDYLEALQMRASAAAFDPFHYPRIAQLTQRSNQFNLRTVRYTEAEIEALAQDDSRIGLYFTLKDKFGDHGLISVVVLEKQPEDTLFISEWLMSCRVLKRGMEEFIVDKILSVAAQQGFRRVVGEYIPTPKNAMVKDLYEQLGFARLENGRFQAEVSGFPYHKTFITEE